MKPFKKIINKHIGDLLVERGSIHRENLNVAVAYQKEKGGLLGEILVELKFATEENISHPLTFHY